MKKTDFGTLNIVSLLLGDEDLGSGAPRPLPGHLEDRLASMGDGVARSGRRRFSRRREG